VPDLFVVEYPYRYHPGIATNVVTGLAYSFGTGDVHSFVAVFEVGLCPRRGSRGLQGCNAIRSDGAATQKPPAQERVSGGRVEGGFLVIRVMS